MAARVLIWLVLLICASFFFGILALVAAISTIDDGQDLGRLATAGIQRDVA